MEDIQKYLLENVSLESLPQKVREKLLQATGRSISHLNDSLEELMNECVLAPVDKFFCEACPFPEEFNQHCQLQIKILDTSLHKNSPFFQDVIKFLGTITITDRYQPTILCHIEGNNLRVFGFALSEINNPVRMDMHIVSYHGNF